MSKKHSSGRRRDSQKVKLTCDDSLDNENCGEGEEQEPEEKIEIDIGNEVTVENESIQVVSEVSPKEHPVPQLNATASVDLVECDDTIDEDNYNFRMKYRTEMTWQLVYFVIWNFLSRHAWGIWIEFAGVVFFYSLVGLFGSLNPSRYPASWCLWAVKSYLWLNPFLQIYNAMWLARLFFLDNVFWFTYVTMILNFGVLYCGYVSASEYYENDLIYFIQNHQRNRQESAV